MAREAREPHPLFVSGPRRTDSGDQRGLPGFRAEDVPLPSSLVLSGAVLDRRRLDARAQMVAALGVCPEGYSAEEWAVVRATLAPAPVPHGVASGGTSGRLRGAEQARTCFPMLSTPAAVRAFAEVAARPHVAALVKDFRALEMLDIHAQREQCRDVLVYMRDLVYSVDAGDVASDLSGVAKLMTAATGAVKMLVDLDDLRARHVDDEPVRATSADRDPHDALEEALARVVGDLAARGVV